MFQVRVARAGAELRQALPYLGCREHRDREEWHQGHDSSSTQPACALQRLQLHVRTDMFPTVSWFVVFPGFKLDQVEGLLMLGESILVFAVFVVVFIIVSS